MNIFTDKEFEELDEEAEEKKSAAVSADLQPKEVSCCDDRKLTLILNLLEGKPLACPLHSLLRARQSAIEYIR